MGAGEIGKVEVGGRLEWAKILFLWIIGWGIKRDIVRSLQGWESDYRKLICNTVIQSEKFPFISIIL